jgi:hypothetical protein
MNYLEIELFYHLLPVPIGKHAFFYKIHAADEVLPIVELNNP